MASSSSAAPDYFSNRPAIRTRPPSTSNGLAGAPTPNVNSPRTPLLGRSVSSQFGSPGSFRSEQEDHVIYELGARHFSAGWAGESRPRCIHLYNPEDDRRVGDYRSCDPGYRRKRRKLRKEEDWGTEHELYRTDLRSVDLGFVEDKLERVVRKIHIDYLQLDQKPRKAVLVIPSLLPTPVVELALKVLFNHHAQPPSVMLLTNPLLASVGAGVRNALVVDLGWEETVVTTVGEYKEVAQLRSIRGGKMLLREMAKMLEGEVKNQLQDDATGDDDRLLVSFEYAEEVTRRMAWCRQRDSSSHDSADTTGMVKLPSPALDDLRHIHLSFNRLSRPVETVLLDPDGPVDAYDDHELPIPDLAYRVLLSLPLDLRALCVSRIIITGGLSNIPGLKSRILQEVSQIIESRGWDPVHSYGSATAHHEKALAARSINLPSPSKPIGEGIPLSPAKKPIQDNIPHAARIHDDIQDPITKKIDTEIRKGKIDAVKGTVRGVETLGAWAGASLVASLRVKGVHEVEREEFLKHGLNDGSVLM
jgi:actin-related protein